MRTIDGYLSRRAQRLYPTATVTHEANTDYRLERPGVDPVGLGPSHGEASQALDALRLATAAAAAAARGEG